MRVIVFGGSGMVGQGVLQACVASGEVTEVVAVVRKAGDAKSAGKVRELIHADFFDWNGVDLTDFDACFFCLGVSSLGMKEPEYRRVTYDLTMACARPLLEQSPQAAFVYVSGAGTDANGKQMWARVKGATENALLGMGFRAAFMFRPGVIIASKGVRSKVAMYNAMYAVMGWTLPIVRKFWPDSMTSNDEVGRAMIVVARDGWVTQFLCTANINLAAKKL